MCACVYKYIFICLFIYLFTDFMDSMTLCLSMRGFKLMSNAEQTSCISSNVLHVCVYIYIYIYIYIYAIDFGHKVDWMFEGNYCC